MKFPNPDELADYLEVVHKYGLINNLIDKLPDILKAVATPENVKAFAEGLKK